MGLIDWAEEARELKLDDRKDEMRRSRELNSMINESIPKEWGIDPLLDNEQILQEDNLGEKIIGMAGRFNNLTSVYADLYRTIEAKWKRELENKQQVENKDLQVLEKQENDEIGRCLVHYDDLSDGLKVEFDKWVDEKEQEFASKKQARYSRYISEKNVYESGNPFDQDKYYKTFKKNHDEILSWYRKAADEVERRAEFRLFFDHGVIRDAYSAGSQGVVDSVSAAKKVLSQDSVIRAEKLYKDIDHNLSGLFRASTERLKRACKELGHLASDANIALEIIEKNCKDNHESNLQRLLDQYYTDNRSIEREQLDWEANEKTEKWNQTESEQHRLLQIAYASQKEIEDKYKGKKKEIQDEYKRQREILKKSMRDELNGLIRKYRDHMETSFPKAVLRKQYETMSAELDIDLTKRKELKSPKCNIAVGRLFMPLETGAGISGNFAQEATVILTEAYPMMISDAMQTPKLMFPYFISSERGINLLFTYSNDKNEDKRLSRIVNTIGLRFLLNIPAYQIQFCLIDGTGIRTFKSIADVDPAKDKTSSERITGILTGGEVQSKEEQIRNAVSSIRNELSGMTRSLHQYNLENRLASKPYRVLMIQHLPDRIDRETIENLTAMSGMEGGIGFSSVITVPERADEEAKEEIKHGISAIRSNMEILCPETYNGNEPVFELRTKKDNFLKDKEGSARPLLIIDGEEKLSREDFLAELAALLSEECKQHGKKELMYTDIMPSRGNRFRKSAATGVSVELGQEMNGQPFVLNLNDAFIHTVISGKPGAGKSNLLRVVVTGILQNYRPDEIELYIGDYKLGLDYNAISDVDLPQLRMISLANVPAFVILMLDEIIKETHRRASLLKGKEKIDDYNRANPDKPMKRIIVIIDELFQLLQDASEEQAEKILKEISQIAHQHRAFGVHLILSSQQITSINGIEDVIKMCHNRIIFDTEDDLSKFVRPEARSTADDIFNGIGPEDKGKCMFTNDSGAHVSKCQVVKLDDEDQKSILKEIEQECRSEKKYSRILLAQPYLCERHPFTEFCRQGKLPPVIEYYKEENQIKKAFLLWIGQTLDSATSWGVEAPDGSLWIIGGEGEAENAGRAVMFYSLISLVMEKCRCRLNGGDLKIMYCDALDESTGLESADGGFVRDAAFCGEYWDYFPGLGWNEDDEEIGLTKLISVLSEEVAKRCSQKSEKEEAGETVLFEPIWALINRMEINQEFTDAHMDDFREVLRKGKSVNVHVIVWTKTSDRNRVMNLNEVARNRSLLQTLVLQTKEFDEFRTGMHTVAASGCEAQLIAPQDKGRQLRIYELSDNNRDDVAGRLAEKNFTICDEKNIFKQI